MIRTLRSWWTLYRLYRRQNHRVQDAAYYAWLACRADPMVTRDW